MKESAKQAVQEIENKFGRLNKLGDGQSLFEIPTIGAVIYFRYSKISQASKHVKKAFYGLRKSDTDLMMHRGKKSFLYLLTDDQQKNLLIPFNQYETYFSATSPSDDGQYKTLSFFKPTGAELYFSNIGKFNAESYFSLEPLLNISHTRVPTPLLSHHQVQSLIGSIGIAKGFDIWYPENDKGQIDTAIVAQSKIISQLPYFNADINHIISEIDVIWVAQNKPVSFWEVEHSTPIYSGLLRFNDVLLTIAGADNFNIVAEREREGKFGREVNRPTFKQNKLIDKVAFIDYENIYTWFHNLTGKLYASSIDTTFYILKTESFASHIPN
jgi:hypothetical protein